MASQVPDWAALAEGIRVGDKTAVEQFYTTFNEGFRWFIQRRIGSQDLDDNVHECFMTVIAAIRQRPLREDERFVGYAMTIVRRYISQAIAKRIANRSHNDAQDFGSLPSAGLSPESSAMQAEGRQIARRVLSTLSRRDRDVLERFYLRDETEQEICEALNLSRDQFRNTKHRAKAKFVAAWRRWAAPRPRPRFPAVTVPAQSAVAPAIQRVA
jgi:RNA polymerase sigma factor (sigma-70 family)